MMTDEREEDLDESFSMTHDGAVVSLATLLQT